MAIARTSPTKSKATVKLPKGADAPMTKGSAGDDIETADESLLSQAQKFFELASTAESSNRAKAVDDIKFSIGDQWSKEVTSSRNLDEKPQLTINRLDSAIRSIANNQRQQRPRIKVHGINDASDKQVAQIVQGICRHIEVQSDADSAYDVAFNMALRGGWGYVRLRHDYFDEDSFDQEIFIETIHNPFSVYWDPFSYHLDGSDATCCMVTDMLSREEFKRQYPNAQISSYEFKGDGDTLSLWVTQEQIRIAEYFYTEYEKETLFLLEDGTTIWQDEYEKQKGSRANPKPKVISERASQRKKIKWCKLSGVEILEQADIMGKYIPIVPVIGHQINVAGTLERFGIVRGARDVQRMYNYWNTQLTESIALAPRAPWLVAEESIEGHESEWEDQNTKNAAVLTYKALDEDGSPIAPPQRIAAAEVPQAVIIATKQVAEDLQNILGTYDVTQLPAGQQSGKALLGQQAQTDIVNFNFYDNLTKSIAQVGQIILGWIPYIYDTQRTLRIIGADGRPQLVKVNQLDEASGKVLNDLTVGRYDVAMETGPGYDSKRQEAQAAMVPLFTNNEQLFAVAGDLLFRSFDFPGSEVIADRLAASNPMAQIDPESQIPPQLQMQIKQLQGQLQQATQQLQAQGMMIKQRQDIETVRQDHETKRELMKQTAKAHDIETRNEVRVHDVNTRATAQMNVAEINAMVQLMLKHIDTAQLEKEIAQRDKELEAKQREAVDDIDDDQNPLAATNPQAASNPMAQQQPGALT